MKPSSLSESVLLDEILEETYRLFVANLAEGRWSSPQEQWLSALVAVRARRQHVVSGRGS